MCIAPVLPIFCQIKEVSIAGERADDEIQNHKEELPLICLTLSESCGLPLRQN